jgi:hypothetical protein
MAKTPPHSIIGTQTKDGREPAKISNNHHAFLTEAFTCLVTKPTIRWANLISLFNSPAGFKGKVYGKSTGSSNTFEVYLKFKETQLIEFLSESEFKILQKNAEPELQKNRKFLIQNKRLSSYGLPTGESIATSLFTLHNPHPSSFIYTELLKRLRHQLNLLELTPEQVKSKK